MTVIAVTMAVAGQSQELRSLRPIRAVIAEHSSTFGVVLPSLLAIENRVEVVGRVADGQEAIEAVSVLNPDLLLIDVRIPHIDGITAAAILADRHPALNIVLMYDHNLSSIATQTKSSTKQFVLYKPRFAEEFPSVLSTIESNERAGSETHSVLHLE